MKVPSQSTLAGLVSDLALPTVAEAAAKQAPAASSLLAALAPRGPAAPASSRPRPRAGSEAPGSGSTGGAGQPSGGRNAWPSRLAKAVGLGAAGAYAYDKSANHFFLSSTSLHDGKGGFTSNERLDRAVEEAQTYRRQFHDTAPEDRVHDAGPPGLLRRVGQNQFLTMTDFRAATQLEVAEAANTPQARQTLIDSVACFTGQRIKPEAVARFQPSHVPADFDLTRSAAFKEKNKYALTGVPNEETGASGYTSRSATQPFINKGMKHFWAENEARGQSPEQCLQALNAALEGQDGLSPEAQFAAGQFLLNFRQVFAREEHWGDAERVVLAMLKDKGLVSAEEADKIDATLLFEDPNKSVFKRNTSLAGPLLHQIDTAVQSRRLKDDKEAVQDLQAMAKQKNTEGLPLMHVKVNEQGNGFEDASGLGDSFTCLNACACMYFARLMSGMDQMTKDQVKVVIACFNAVYDDASSVRHTLHEIARGCFVGAGYTTQDADEYYANVCRQASEAHYGGKALLHQRTDPAPLPPGDVSA